MSYSEQLMRLPAAVRLRRPHPVLSFLGRRLAAAVITVFIASLLVFFSVHLLPGNVATAILGKDASKSALHTLDQQLGLNRPLLAQYGSWLFGLLHGNLGTSAAALANGSPSSSVWSIIADPLRNTMILAGMVIVLLLPLSLLLGAALGAKAGRPTDIAVTGGLLVFVSLPEFVLGTMLVVVFFSWLKLLPPIALVAPGALPFANPKALVLPVLTLLLTNLAWTTRLVRAGMVEQLQTEWVQSLQLSGFSQRFVVWRAALRNALAPSVQVFALAAQYLFGGVIVTEILFAYPGIGTAFVTAVNARDVTTVADIAMLIGTAYVLINILADFAVTLLVPKLRLA